MCECTCKPATPLASGPAVVTLKIEAEFELGDNELSDIMDNIRNAIEELNNFGYVHTAKLSVPATEMDLT